MKKIFILFLFLIPSLCFAEQIDEMAILGINLNSTVQEVKRKLDDKYPLVQSLRETYLISELYKDSIVYRFRSSYPTYAGKIVKKLSVNVASYDNREEAEFYIQGALGYELLPVFCDDVK